MEDKSLKIKRHFVKMSKKEADDVIDGMAELIVNYLEKRGVVKRDEKDVCDPKDSAAKRGRKPRTKK